MTSLPRPSPAAPAAAARTSARPARRAPLALVLTIGVGLVALLGGGCAEDGDPFTRGEEALARGDARAAANEFQRALDEKPRRYDARLKLGQALFQLKDYRGAIRQFEKAQEIDPTNAAPELSIVSSYFHLGQRLSEQKRHEQADDAFEAALRIGQNLVRKFPESAPGYERLARVHTSRFFNRFEDLRTMVASYYSNREVDLMMREINNNLYGEEWAPVARGKVHRFFEAEYPFDRLESFLEDVDRLRQEYESILVNLRTALAKDPTLTSAAKDLGSILFLVRSYDQAREMAGTLLETPSAAEDPTLTADERRDRERDRNYGHLLLANIEVELAEREIAEKSRRTLPDPNMEAKPEGETPRERFETAARQVEQYLAGPVTATEKLEGQQKICRLYYEIGELAHLEETADAILSQRKTDPIGLLYSGISRYFKKENTGAIDRLRKAMVTLSNDPRGQYVLGLALQEDKKASQAVQALREAIKLAPNDSRAYIALVRLSLQEQWYEDALDLVQSAVKLDPQSREVRELVKRTELAVMGKELLTEKVRTEEQALDVLKRNPGQLFARFRLAQIQLRNGKAAVALREVTGLLRLLPDHYPLKLLEARANAEVGQVALARDQLLILAARHPYRPEARLELAQLEYVQRRTRSARRNLTIAKRIAEDDVDTRIFSAKVAIDGGYYNSAVKDIADVLVLEPGHTGALVLKSRLALVQGNAAKAEADMRALLKETPDFALARLVLAESLVAQERYPEAEAALREFLAAFDSSVNDPEERARGRSLLVEIYARQNRVDDVLAEIKSLREASRHGDASLALARIHREGGRPDMAVRALQKARQFEPQNVAVLLALGEVMKEAGDGRGALKTFQRAAALDPANRDALKEVALLRSEGGSKRDRRALVRALSANQGDIELNLLMADYLLAEGRQSALDGFFSGFKQEKIPKAVRNSARYRSREIQYKLKINRPDEARKMIHAAAKKATKDEEARIFVPLAISMGEYELAERLLGAVGSREWLAEHRDGHGAATTTASDHLAVLGRALIMQLQGDLEGALEVVDTLLSIQPGSKTATSFAGFLLVGLGRPDEALKRLETVFQDRYTRREFVGAMESTKKETGLGQRLALHFNEGLYFGSFESLQHQAAEAYRRLIELLPQSALAYDRLAALYVAAGNRPQALIELHAEMRRNPEYVPAYVMAARLLHQMGKAPHADRLFQDALNFAPDDASIYKEYAIRTASNRGNRQSAREALALFKKARELDPDDSSLLVHLGKVYDRLGESEQAMKALREAVELRPEDLDAHRALMKLYVQDKDEFRDEATELARLMSERFPEEIDTRSLLASLLVKEGRLDEAREAFGELRDQFPFDPRPLAGLASVEEKAKHVDEQMYFLQGAVALDPGRVKDAELLAEYVARQGKYQEAAAYYGTVVFFQPENKAARRHLIQLEDYLGHVDEALELARRGVEILPNDAEANYDYGYMLYKKGKYNDAQSLLEKASDLDPEMAVARYLSAVVYHARGLPSSQVNDKLREALRLGLDPATEAEALKLQEKVAPRSRGGLRSLRERTDDSGDDGGGENNPPPQPPRDRDR